MNLHPWFLPVEILARALFWSCNQMAWSMILRPGSSTWTQIFWCWPPATAAWPSGEIFSDVYWYFSGYGSKWLTTTVGLIGFWPNMINGVRPFAPHFGPFRFISIYLHASYLINNQLSIDLPNHLSMYHVPYIYKYGILICLSIYVNLSLHPCSYLSRDTHTAQTQIMYHVALATHWTSLKTDYESTVDCGYLHLFRAALSIPARRRQEATGLRVRVAETNWTFRNVHPRLGIPCIGYINHYCSG